MKRISYVFKYITKDVVEEIGKDGRRSERKIYVSRNLEKPDIRKEYTDERIEDIIFSNMEHIISEGAYEIKSYNNYKLNEVDYVNIKK